MTDLPAGLRVLVADPSGAERRVLADLIESFEGKALPVASGREALAVVEASRQRGERIDLALRELQRADLDGIADWEKIKADATGDVLPVLILSGAGQRGDGVRCRQRRVAGYLNKPVSMPELRAAIAQVVSIQKMPSGVFITRHQLREAHNGLRVLLAEDNLVNQRVACRLLEKRGYQVAVVENGLQAVEAVRTTPFDVVLMDVQMPEMDGLEATEAIRKMEVGTARRVPIVAMTAHAMQGYRDLCVQAGMDDYVTKPIVPEKLFQILDELRMRRAVPNEDETGASPSESLAVGAPSPGSESEEERVREIFAREEALSRIGGDEDFLRELVGLVLTEIPEQMARFQEACRNGETSVAERLAHSVKGAAGNVGARSVVLAARNLEESVRKTHSGQ